MNKIQNTDHHPRHSFSRPCCPGIASYQLVPQKITHLVNSQYVRRFFNSILTLPPKFFLLFTPSHKVFQPIVKRYFYTATPVSTQ